MGVFDLGQLETNGLHFQGSQPPVKAAERLYLVLRVLHHGDLAFRSTLCRTVGIFCLDDDRKVSN